MAYYICHYSCAYSNPILRFIQYEQLGTRTNDKQEVVDRVEEGSDKQNVKAKQKQSTSSIGQEQTNIIA